jgi:pSer/pThr/pTyr-binding forkhead associated (FHA) protein
MARLILNTGDGERQVHRLEAGEVVIGRSSKNGISIPSGKVSRQHARVFREGATFVVEDMGSSNGTRVNGRRMHRQVLRNEDVIQIGDATLTFDEVSDDPLIGETLRGYEIRNRLGTGPFGPVYLAWQASMDREVALEVLTREMAEDAELVKRFEADAKVAARLNHPHLVLVHDFGQAKGQYFYAAELVSGPTAYERVAKEGALDPDFCARTGAFLAEGLAHAHASEIYHQDITPRRVLFTASDEAKLSGTGFAPSRLRAGVEPDMVYAAPEVLHKLPADARSDLYSLGAVLFHMATGKAPFPAGNPDAARRQKLEGATPDPLKVNPELPGALADAIDTLMTKDPTRRPPTATEVVEMLRSMKSARPSVAAPAGAKREAGPRGGAAAPVPAGRPAPAASGEGRSRSERRRGIESTRNQARLVMYVVSVLVALVLAGLVHQFFLAEDPQAEAARLLRLARRQIERGEPDEAMASLQTATDRYGGTDAALEAARLLGELRIQGRIRRVENAVDADRMGIDEGLAQLQRLRGEARQGSRAMTLIADAAERLRQRRLQQDRHGEDQFPDDAEQARDQWKKVSAEVEDMVERDRIDLAIQMLEVFAAEYSDSEYAEEARQMLDRISRQEADTFGQDLAHAQEILEQDRLGEAWERLEELYRRESEPERRQEVLAAMAEVDGRIRPGFLGLLEPAWQACARLKTDEIEREAEDLALRARDLQWATSVRLVQKEAEWATGFRQAMVEAVLEKPTRLLPVPGFAGGVRLQVGPGEVLQVIPGPRQKPTPYPWSRLPEDVMYMLTPPGMLSAEERLGAAVHFAGRRHFGYAETYRDAAGEGRLAEILEADIGALPAGRRLTDFFDFAASSQEQNERWQPALDHLGSWSIGEGALAMSGDRPRAYVAGRLYGMKNTGVRLSVDLGMEGGEARLVLDAGPEAAAVVAHLRRGTTAISQQNPGAEVARQEGYPMPGTSEVDLLFLVQDGQCRLFDADRNAELVGLQHSIPADALARLRLECDALTTTWHSIVVEEGP